MTDVYDDDSPWGTKPTDHDCYDFADCDDSGYMYVWYCAKCGGILQVGGRAHPREDGDPLDP